VDIDIFLSHSSLDAEPARQLRAALNAAGLTTWLAPDDVTSARPWAEQVRDAAEGARLLIVLVSAAASASDHVAREVAIAVRRKAPVLPVRLDAQPLAGSLDYLLQLVQRLDAFPGGMERHAEAVAARAASLIRDGAQGGLVIPEAEPPRASRRTVTVLVANVQASTERGETLDPEALKGLAGRYLGSIRQIVERHGGTVDQSIGGAVMAVFGVPAVHEDDALRAVRAAADIRETLAALEAELQATRGYGMTFRIGVDTGRVVAGDPSDRTLVTGDPVGTASRLAQAGQPGEVLIGAQTHRLVRDAVEVEPAEAGGGGVPAGTNRLVSVAAGVAGRARRLDTPLVGRERELARLEQAYRQAVADRSCQLFTVLGTAGVGKSRLVAEFLVSLRQEATVVKGRCLPYGEGITYWPVREIVHQAASVDEGETAEAAVAKLSDLLLGEPDAAILASRIASAIGLSTDARPQEEIFWATRRLLEHLARDRPLVVLVEDIHWAESVLLDLLEHVADLARDAPLLLLCAARPELLEKRPAWGGGKVNATAILLEPLASDATERLIEALPGGRALPAELRARILGAAEGNPLYLEEMLGMLIDEQLVVERDGEWRAEREIDRVSVPPTVQALLAARLDQLPPVERAIAERGSVIGRVFEQAAVAELASDSLKPEVGRGLVALVRKELVRPERSDLAAGDAFKFRHMLIRDAAYDALPKADRAELHERFAAWLTRVTGPRALEYAEIVGYHLEQAYRYRTELGESGPSVEGLGHRAGELLAQGGDRAIGRGDAAAAVELYRRATDVLPRDRLWAATATSLANAEYLRLNLESAVAHLDEVILLARSLGDERLESRASVVRANVAFFNGEPTDPRAAQEAIEIFENAGDAEGLAAAWAFRATLAGETGDPGEAEAAQQALRYARTSGNKQIEARAIQMLSAWLLFGPHPSAEAIIDGERLLEQAGTNLRAAAKVRSNLSAVVAMRGDFDRARTMADEGLDVLRDLGLASAEAMSRTLAAMFIEMPAGRYEVAEAELRASYIVLERTDAKFFMASVAGGLAEALALQGKDDEAEEWAVLADENAPAADYDAQVRWRRARARILINRGSLGEAETLAQSAVEMSAGTDDVCMQGDSFATLADVLSAAGRAEEAAAALRQALARYERKGNLVAAQKTVRALAALVTAAPREP
jgi:class 3 adenylate cyclase/tetratricopeptide (TPR) repeat protein